MTDSGLILDFYGATVAVQSDVPEIIAHLKFDFAYFCASSAGRAALTIRYKSGKLPLDLLPALPASTHAPQYVSYDWDDKRYVNYYGAAQVLFDYATEEAEFYARDHDLGYERLYLLILSRVGEFLDRKGLHRVHALGFSCNGKAVIVLLPMHGGKSTLALRILDAEGIQLLSEDTPLIARDGTVLPFPIRFGVIPGEEPAGIPAGFVRRFQRRQYGEKVLIDTTYYSERIASAPVPAAIVITARWLSRGEATIREAGRFLILSKLLRDCVVGLGLPQVVEFFLRATWKDLFSKTRLVFSRSWACLRIAARCRGYELLLGADRNRNAELLLRTVRAALDGR